MAKPQHTDLHLYDSELAGLARRGYQGGMPIQLLSDAFLYERHGSYFHTIDGRFAKIWKLRGMDASLLNNADLWQLSRGLGDVLNKYPAGSAGQFIRHTHRDIREVLGIYRANINAEDDEFAAEIANSIVDRQIQAAGSPDGFFTKLSDQTIEKMREDALAEIDDEQLRGNVRQLLLGGNPWAEEDEDVKSNVTEEIQREVSQGRYPYVTDFYLVLLWSPEYLFGKFIDNTAKSALASMGLIDANKLAHREYTKHAKKFGQLCHEIGQALAAFGFSPASLNGQGLINWQYQLFNPVRSFKVEPPRYRPDLPVLDCLKNPSTVPNREALNDAPLFASVETEEKGWTIHDSGVPYYIRPVSALGKPLSSFPGMLQVAMSGIESESLVTINWSVPSPVAMMGRLWARGRMQSGKEAMKIGDKDLLAQQRIDLEKVKSKISAENGANREQFFDVSLHINLMGFVEHQVDDQAMQLENRLWRVGHKEAHRGDAAVRNSMPLNFRQSSMKLFRRDTPHLTESLSHLCPFFVEYQGCADPAILMNNRAGQPIYLDLWGKMTNTAHSLICGSTGTGKSFTFNNLLMALRVKYRPKVWIIDKGDSYESLCLVLDGNYIRLATEPFKEPITGRTINPICINPFWIGTDENGQAVMPSLEDMFFIARMLVMMITSSSSEQAKTSVITPVTVPLLYQALNEFYTDWIATRPKDEPRFRDFIPYLVRTKFTEQSGETLAQALTLYYGSGPFAALFDGFLQVQWDNDFTVLETQRMAKSPALPVVTLALFRQIDLYCKFKLDRSRKKIVAVDEAWATLSDPTAASALSSFYRELRRYGAGCLLISQTVKDFVKLINAETSGTGDSQDGILENTSHYFFLACSQSDYDVAQQHLAFTNEEIDLWRSLASLPPLYSEVFYRMRTTKSEYYSGVFRLFASPMALWIASSHPDDYHMRERKTQEIVKNLSISESKARQKAISELAKTHPYGARYNVNQAA
ncbi:MULTISPECIES: VirB4 family type IV secretion system protein [Pseudomonas]|uniref:TraG P-loop domain-containing protein n=1 Tax=Pseudomonas nitroreducens TaxID=46680 RepID=A0A6G6JAP3_PSENT|nr:MULTISPECIES: FtsK/SpoIIIE domain-containing protein [Pseudomonas]MDU4254102.1 FtsK/SpoIIIE domain-containing protein [Pseudomonas sp.]QIE91541.1 hypothetical protein G5B91_35000 [Pseudomonas nitroreducens]